MQEPILHVIINTLSSTIDNTTTVQILRSNLGPVQYWIIYKTLSRLQITLFLDFAVET